MKKFVVRVVQTYDPENLYLSPGGGEISQAFIDSLNHAGLIVSHDVDPRGRTIRCFDLMPDSAIVDTKLWAEGNAERMQGLGFNAVCAPSTI